jgi:hypothetical protein
VNAVYEAKLGRTADGISLPDFLGSLADGPSDDFVISLHRDGTPASKFGDLIWDFTAYHPERRTFGLYFSYWGNTPGTPEQLALSRIVRRVVFSLIWHRPGASLSLRTLANYLIVLCAAARHSEELGISLGTLFGDAKQLPRYAGTNCSGWMCETLGSLLGVLASIKEDALGFRVVPSKTIAAIKSKGRAYRDGLKQHSPIPTRIYSAVISGLQQELCAWLLISEEALKLAKACAADPFMGRSHTTQRDDIAKKLGVEWGSFEARPTFDDLCPQSVASYLIATGKDLNVKSLSFVIAEMQVVCKLIIQTFTGMRDDEACSLPYYCLETTVAHGKSHYVVEGRTTKFNHGLPKRTRWVTNREGQKAIEAAQAIADAIYGAYDAVPTISAGQRSSHPLFPTPGYMNLASTPMTPEGGHFVPGTLVFRHGSLLPERLFSAIEEEDLRELDQIDPHRAWRSEEAFQIGRPWGFKTHQLRRSLALYAQRSGLVSLPSLRRQLQHLTEEMSRYYAKGSAFAKDFIGEEKDHFGLEWQATQPESAALGYILNVLMSDDRLIGGHANWVQHRLKGPDGAVLIDREATMRRFKKGEMAYKETLLGGCTNVEECDQVALKWLSVDCLRDGCKNLVCNVTKLERVVAAQERLVAAIDPQSVEYRTEAADLDVLRSALEQAMKKNLGEPQ